MATPTAADAFITDSTTTNIINIIDAAEIQFTNIATQLQALITAAAAPMVALQALVASQLVVALQAAVVGVLDQLGRFLPLCLLLYVASTRRDWKNLTVTFNYRSCGHGEMGGMTWVN
jgi:hypothetical protein